MSESAFFTCISLQKRLVLEKKEEAHREQQRALEHLVEQASCESSIVLPGGCLLGKGVKIGRKAGYAAALRGNLEGVTQLVEKYVKEEAKDGSGQLKDAEILCCLYKDLGRTVPQKLKGDYSFVLFDPAQGRVLAAASHTSRVPMIQARGSDGSLIITTALPCELPAGSHSVLSIGPGFMKYGWSSDPQQFTASIQLTPRREVLSSPSARAVAARLALSGTDSQSTEGAQDSHSSVQTSSPSFADSEGTEPHSPAPKKTRRGKRGGRNQKLRAETLKQMAAGELGRANANRASIDLASLPSASMSASSFTSSRADEQNWWRTNTPRQSLELPSFSSSSGSGSTPPLRRFSMSAAAPVFVPGQPGLFTRQSVPAAKPKTTALSFPCRSKAPQPRSNETLLVASQTNPTAPYEDPTMVSPFFDKGQTASPQRTFQQSPAETEGKADAAWEEESKPAADEHAAESSNLAGQGQPDQGALSGGLRIKPLSGVGGGTAEPSEHALGSGPDRSNPNVALGRTEQSALPKVLTEKGRDDEFAPNHRLRDSSLDVDSPSGMSPGGSPTAKPPKIPIGAFKQFLKSIIPRRGSQVDLWAEAGSSADPRRHWSRSSSHGNLVGLHANDPGRDVSEPYPRSGSGNLPQAPLRSNPSHRVLTREDTARQSLGRLHGSQEDLLMSRLKLSENSHPNSLSHSTAAQWIASKTRSMFGKSKSCTDLHQIDSNIALQPAGMEVK